MAHNRLTRSQLLARIDEKWFALHALKTRFVNACNEHSKKHYRKAMDALEQEHFELWDQLHRGDYIDDNPPKREVKPTEPEDLPF